MTPEAFAALAQLLRLLLWRAPLCKDCAKAG